MSSSSSVDGVSLLGSLNTLTNEGVISVTRFAVYLPQTTAYIGHFVNRGYIAGNRAVAVFGSSSTGIGTLDNYGNIGDTSNSISNFGIDIVGGRIDTINNHAGATIAARYYAVQQGINGIGQIREINNAGTIDGAMILYDVDLNIQGASSRITGAVTNPLTGFGIGGSGSVNVLAGADFTTENTFASNTFAVRNGGTLRIGNSANTITVANGFLNEGSLVIPDNVQARIVGDYTQTGHLEIGASSAAQRGQLNVSGTARIRSGASFGVDVNAVNSLANGETLVSVISAGNLVNEIGVPSVSDNSALFDFEFVENGNAVDLRVVAIQAPPPPPAPAAPPTASPPASPARVDAPPPAPSPQSVLVPATLVNGLTSGVPAATVIDRFVMGGNRGDDWDNVVTALGKLPTQKSLAVAVGQSMPLMHGDLGAALMGSGAAAGASTAGAPVSFGGSFSYQGREYNTGDRQLWVQPMNIAGYKSTTTGVAAGVSHALSDGQTIGAGIGYLDTNISGSGYASGQHADVTGVQLRGFGEHAIGSGGYQFNWQADLTRNSIESQRHISYIGRKAEGETDADVWHIGAGVSRAMELSKQTQLEPMVNLDWRQARVDGYTETGADALNLKVAKQKAEELVLSVGARLEHAYSEKLSVSGLASVGYDLKGDTGITTAQFTGGGAVFTTESQETARERLQLGATLNWKATKAVDLSVGYGIQRRSGMTDQALTAKLNWLF